MLNAIDQVKTHLDRLELHYRQLSEDALVLPFGGKHTRYEALIVEQGPVLSVRVPAFARVPRHRMDETLRLANMLLGRILRVGAFWVDAQTSSLAFEFGFPAVDGVSERMVSLLISVLFDVDHFFPIFATVWWADLTAEQAFAKIGASDERDESDDEGLDLAI